MITYRQVNAVRSTLATVLIAGIDDPRIEEAVREAVGELDVMLCDIAHDDEERGAVTDALIEHVESKPLSPIRPFNLTQEIEDMFRSMHKMTRVGMGVEC